MLTPHIVRMPALNEENLRGIYIGTETNTRMRAPVAPPVPAAHPRSRCCTGNRTRFRPTRGAGESASRRHNRNARRACGSGPCRAATSE